MSNPWFGMWQELMKKAVSEGQLSKLEELLKLAGAFDNPQTWQNGPKRSLDDCYSKDRELYRLSIVAVEQKRAKILQFFLNNGLNVNYQDNDDTTSIPLLCKAVVLGNVEIVKILLDNGADISAKQKQKTKKAKTDGASVADGQSALDCAAQSGNEEIFKLLLNHGACISEQSTMACALEGDNSNILKILQTESTKRAFHDAAKQGQLKVIQELISYGFDIFAKDECDRTALHHACNCGHLEIVKLLLLSADINDDKYGSHMLCSSQDNDSLTALDLAASKGDSSLVKELLNRMTCDVEDFSCMVDDAFQRAALNGHTEVMREMEFHGCWDDTVKLFGHYEKLLRNPEFKHRDKLASYIFDTKSRLADVKFLFNSHMYPTPFCVAAENGYLEIIKLCLEKNYDVEMKNYSFEGALVLAVESNQPQAFDLLLKSTYSVDVAKVALFEIFIIYNDLYLTDPPRLAVSHKYRLVYNNCNAFYLPELYLKLFLEIKKQSDNVEPKTIFDSVHAHRRANFRELIPAAVAHLEEFEVELCSMKLSRIPNTPLTVYDILICSNLFTKCIRNKSVVEIFSNENFCSNFPKYSQLMRENYLKAAKKSHLMSKVEEAYAALYKDKTFDLLPLLPVSCVREISLMLEDKDLMNVIVVLKLFGK